MQYEYTREHMMPVVIEVSHQDLQLIQKMAQHFVDLETMPEGIYKGEARRMEREATEALRRVARSIKSAFPSTDD
jgi:hypothetical protein